MTAGGDSESRPLRVVIADDRPVFRDGLRLVVESTPGLCLVGEAAGGEEAVAAVEEFRPDVVLMDLQMPGLNGIDATRQIVAAHPQTAVLVLTLVDEDVSVMAAMKAGARGYLLKDASRADIVSAVEAICRNQMVLGSTVGQRVVEQLAARRRGPDAAFPHLTDREREVLDLMARGQSNQAIASRLFLSGKTVRNHVSNIFNKLSVADRAQAIVRAREAGLGQDQQSRDNAPGPADLR